MNFFQFSATFFLLLVTKLTFAWNAPSISSPAAGSDNWVGITLNWNSVSGSQFYQVQIDTTPQFNSPILYSATKAYINSVSSNSDTQENPPALRFGQNYFWRVRAYITGDTSIWTNSSFVTRDYVTQSSPASGSDVWAGLTLNWAPHSGVQFYQVQADTSAWFNSPALRVQTNAYVNSTDGNGDTQHYITDLYFGTNYKWRVRAINAVDTTAWSPVWTFVTRDYVTQSSPAIGSDVWAGTTLNWTPHTGVQFYQVQADTSALFNSPALRVQTNAYVNSTDGNGDTQHYITDLYFGTNYNWRVRAINAVDTTAWSPVWTFITRNYVSQTSPASGSDVWAGLTLNWAPHSGVQFYQVQADTSAWFSSPALRVQTNAYVNSTDGNGDTQHYITDLYFGTNYNWRVRAINAVDTMAWSPVWNFITRDYVSLSSPADAATNISLNPTLNWTPHTGVGSYTLQVDVSNLFNTGALQTFQKPYINSTDGNSDTQQGISGLAANTVYFWRVRANNSVDSSAWTTRWFSTGAATPVFPGTPSLNVGQCGISQVNTQSHTLTWNTVVEADYYQLELRLNGQLYGSPTVSAINGTSFTPNNLLEGFTYQWRVRAVAGTLVGTWSSVCSFTTQAAVSISAPLLNEIQNCAGNEISFSSITSDNFGANNVFSVFLSNASGDFSFPPPSLLGTFSNSGSTIQTFNLPANAIGSNNYKIRISSSEPQFTGAASSPFTINVLPIIEGDLNLLVCAQSTEVELPIMEPQGGIYEGNGVIGNTFHPDLTGPGIFQVSYTYTNNATGCSATAIGTASVEACTNLAGEVRIINKTITFPAEVENCLLYDLQGRNVGNLHTPSSLFDVSQFNLPKGIYIGMYSIGGIQRTFRFALI